MSIQGSRQFVYLSRSNAISKFQVDYLYHFLPLMTRKFWRYGLIKQCLQDIFSFKNLMTHIVCHHYAHMAHIKFFQKTDQMINTSHDLIFLIYLDKYQLGFTLSCVRVSDSKTSHFFKAYHAFDDITVLG